MKVIYKYPIINRANVVKMQRGAEILKFDIQGGFPTLWALVDTNQQEETRQFAIYGTGWEITAPLNKNSYIGTAFEEGKGLVWHCFEVKT